MGTQYQAIQQERLYSGVFGRSDRIALLFLSAMASYFIPDAMLYAVYIILVLSVLTFLQRFWTSAKKIGGL